jgi:hypothetical protein
MGATTVFRETVVPEELQPNYSTLPGCGKTPIREWYALSSGMMFRWVDFHKALQNNIRVAPLSQPPGFHPGQLFTSR